MINIQYYHRVVPPCGERSEIGSPAGDHGFQRNHDRLLQYIKAVTNPVRKIFLEGKYVKDE
jgi:hypothetical protein